MTPEAERLYAAALARRPEGLVARDRAGVTVELAAARWLAGAGLTDLRVLRRARGPVLDIGCGPGRHVRALADRGVAALGIDASPAAVRVARDRGTHVLHGSVFDIVPAMGGWRTALLLDGNIGIGGDPEALLRRLADLLMPDGAVLCECEAPGGGVRSGPLRLEHDAGASRWFPWSRVSVDALERVAAAGGADDHRALGGRRALVRRARGRPDAPPARGSTAGPDTTDVLAQPAARGVADDDARQRPARSASAWSPSPGSCRTRPTSPTWAATASSRRTSAILVIGWPTSPGWLYALNAGPARDGRHHHRPAAAGEAVVGHPAPVRVAAGDRAGERAGAHRHPAARRLGDLPVRHRDRQRAALLPVALRLPRGALLRRADLHRVARAARRGQVPGDAPGLRDAARGLAPDDDLRAPDPDARDAQPPWAVRARRGGRRDARGDDRRAVDRRAAARGGALRAARRGRVLPDQQDRGRRADHAGDGGTRLPAEARRRATSAS